MLGLQDRVSVGWARRHRHELAIHTGFGIPWHLQASAISAFASFSFVCIRALDGGPHGSNWHLGAHGAFWLSVRLSTEG